MPFAGGSRYSYRNYQNNVSDTLNIIPLEYPGRGARMKEALIKDMDLLVNDMLLQIDRYKTNKPYMIYGHSMGGIVGFLVSKKILQRKLIEPPAHLFITGTTAPACKSREAKRRYLLPKKDFITELKNMEGCPEEILNNDDLLNYYEPILRADFEAAETFRYHHDSPVKLSMTVVTGTEEDMAPEDIAMWQQESVDPVNFKRLPGGHFFIFNNTEQIMSMLSNQLSLIKTL